MPKDNSSKTILIIVAVIVGILIIAGIIGGIGFYWLYKVGTSEQSVPTPLAQTEMPITQQLSSYQNERFGFSLKYPATFKAFESQNGDGVTLTSSSPAITIRAYGSPNSSSQTLDEYLNTVRTNLFQEVGSAEEVAATDTTLDGVSAQERKWQYNDAVEGKQTITEQVTALKDDAFYTVQMDIGYPDNSEYAPMFEGVLGSFQIE